MLNASYNIIGGYIAIILSEALLLKYETCNASDTYVRNINHMIVMHLTQLSDELQGYKECFRYYNQRQYHYYTNRECF